jgi:hypothetical protein
MDGPAKPNKADDAKARTRRLRAAFFVYRMETPVNPIRLFSPVFQEVAAAHDASGTDQ